MAYTLLRNLVWLGVVVIAVALIVGCAGGSAGDAPEETPAPAEPTATPDGLAPGPPLGQPCPVAADLCDAAREALAWVATGDVDGLMARARPRTFRCPVEGEPNEGIGHTRDICAGAEGGEGRPGYAVSYGGEGSVETEAQFRAQVTRQFAAAASADGTQRDGYGPGQLRAAGFSCFQEGRRGRAGCDDRFVEVLVTYLPREAPPMLEESRVVLCLEFHRPPGATRWSVAGIGCGVPPTACLYPFDGAGALEFGVDGYFVSYPWAFER